MNKLFFVLLVFVFSGYSQNFQDWKTFTYMNDVTDMLYHNNQIWVTSTGGAYAFNISDSSTKVFTNVDGLSSTNLSSVVKDQNENLIFISLDGQISIYSLLNKSWNYENSLEGQNISDMFIAKDTLWVAADAGVGVLIYNGFNYEFRDFYDDFPTNPEQSNKITLFDNKIYYATINGLYYAPSNFVRYNLKSKENWKTYDTNNILPHNNVRTLNVINDTLYVGTANGAIRIGKDSWTDNAFNWASGTVNNIIRKNDSLYFFRNNDYYVFNGTSWQWIESLNANVNCVAKDENESIWIGFKNQGIMNLDWQQPYLHDGPASNHVARVIKDNNGKLWMTSGKFKVYNSYGFYNYDFNKWTNYKFYDNKWGWKNSTDAVYADRYGNVWYGAWGGGVTMLSENDIIFFHSWPDSGRLVISTSEESYEFVYGDIENNYKYCFPPTHIQNSTYCVVTDFVEDSEGNLWAGVHSSENSKYIVAIPKSSDNSLSMDCNNWVYYGNNVGMGSGEGEVSLMEFDDSGRLWFGTFQSGIVILDYNRTLNNSTDDKIYKVGIEDNLYSNTVLCLKKDQDGVMWIGTAAGLNSYDGQNFYKHIGETGPVENKINYIFVDAFNNKWFATDGGLSILEGDKSPWDESAWRHYTTENSGLAHEIVNSVFVDSDKGEAYIGTEGGLSIFSGAYSEIRSNFDNLSGGPNPYLLDNSSIPYTIKNLMVNSTVKILNINGKLIRILSEENGFVEGSRATWDGRDSNNNLVSSGIYIYLVYSDEGEVSKGKLSVIRK